LSQVVHVSRKVQADFLQILYTYGYFTEEYGLNVMHDVRVLLDEEAIDRVSFIWTETGTNQVLDEFAYKVIIGGIGLADDRSGNIRYYPDLEDADFAVRVTYTDRWRGLPESQKDVIRDDLKLTWGPAGRLDYSSGSWESDRTYSKDGYGLARERFVRPR
jgi:HORMA domain-containing protein